MPRDKSGSPQSMVAALAVPGGKCRGDTCQEGFSPRREGARKPLTWAGGPPAALQEDGPTSRAQREPVAADHGLLDQQGSPTPPHSL